MFIIILIPASKADLSLSYAEVGCLEQRALCQWNMFILLVLSAIPVINPICECFVFRFWKAPSECNLMWNESESRSEYLRKQSWSLRTSSKTFLVVIIVWSVRGLSLPDCSETIPWKADAGDIPVASHANLPASDRRTFNSSVESALLSSCLVKWDEGKSCRTIFVAYSFWERDISLPSILYGSLWNQLARIDVLDIQSVLKCCFRNQGPLPLVYWQCRQCITALMRYWMG